MKILEVENSSRLQVEGIAHTRMEDLADAMDNTVKANEHRLDWLGIKPGEDVRKLAVEGRPTKHINGQPLYMGEVTSNERERYGVARHVQGGAVDVASFLAGEPRCMYALMEPPSPSAKIAIVVGTSASWSVEAEDLDNFGETIAATVSDCMSTGDEVEIWSLNVVRFRNDQYWLGLVRICDTTQSVSIHKLGFAVASASALRVIHFALKAEGVGGGDFDAAKRFDGGLGLPLDLDTQDGSMLGSWLNEAVFKISDCDRMLYVPSLSQLGLGEFRRGGRELVAKSAQTVERPT